MKQFFSLTFIIGLLAVETTKGAIPAISNTESAHQPPAACLSLSDARTSETSPGTKTILVAITARDGTTIDITAVKVLFYIYERSAGGDIRLTTSKLTSQWLSPPIDWIGKEPELLQVKCPLPGKPEEYLGYTVGIYYQGELQDFRAEPRKLGEDFPLPLFLK